ncbi:MAG: PH domain-containing protein [Bacteroidaceae bacterium]|nr:PH domain-containing protein [Bacteroidaceae bacterium]
MGNFIKKSLEEGEEILWQGRQHWSFVFGWLLLFNVLLVLTAAVVIFAIHQRQQTGAWNDSFVFGAAVLAVFTLCVFLYAYILRSKTEFAVTGTRFIQKDGIFDIRMIEIPLFKVETVEFRQTLLQRLIGTGSIVLVGSGGTSHQIFYIEHPLEVRGVIVSTIHKADNEKIVRSESQ